ncbi:MAG TPA: GGDEF domain-containing protein [Woeseiaceae bacterium]|nr:GGDEF domain-containing protein [Woeseiaceae bacterium]
MAEPQESAALPLSLTNLLEQCKGVRAIVEESVEKLSSVSHALKHDFGDSGLSPEAHNALARTEAIEARLVEAFQMLSVVSRALRDEITERHMLNHQFAAVQEQEQSARHRVLHDVLTGLPNRILFTDRLEHGLAQALRHDRPLAVMFIDLIGFKAVNDTYGHDAGDLVLQVMATRLMEHTRSEDTASRHGGDEFLYLIAEAGDEQSTAHVAERIIRMIQEPCNISSHGTEISVSMDVSIGIAISPKDGITVDTLIKSADSAMYRAKQQKSGYLFAL